MTTNRVIDFTNKSHDGMAIWFAEMSVRDLLFHPDDAPSDIICIATNKPMFSEVECRKLKNIISDMFDRFGDDVYLSAYPIFMARMGLRLDS